MKKIYDPTIVVDIDGVLVVSAGLGDVDNVTFSSENKKYIEEIKLAAKNGKKVEIVWGGKLIESGYDTELNILAALFSVAPGRTYVKECSDELKGQLNMNAKLPLNVIL